MDELDETVVAVRADTIRRQPLARGSDLCREGAVGAEQCRRLPHLI